MLQKLTIRQKKLAEYLLIVAGTAVIAVSLQFFLDPDGMVPGGFTGIAIIVKELTKGIVPDGVPLWVTNLVLNDGSYCIKDQWMGLCKAHSGGITSPFFLACSDTICAADGGT